MKRLGALMLLAVFAASLTMPTQAQNRISVQEHDRQVRKAQKKQQKTMRKQDKQQRKAMQKAAKAQRKAQLHAQQRGAH
jgi:hypothetical protein